MLGPLLFWGVLGAAGLFRLICAFAPTEEERNERHHQKEIDKARKAEAARQARIQQLAYLYEAQPHLVDLEFLQKFARKNKDQLLRERDRIIHEYMALSTDILSFITDQPHLAELAAWEMRALTLAEQLDVEASQR